MNYKILLAFYGLVFIPVLIGPQPPAMCETDDDCIKHCKPEEITLGWCDGGPYETIPHEVQ